MVVPSLESRVPLWASGGTTCNGPGYRCPGRLPGIGCSPCHAPCNRAWASRGYLFLVPAVVTCLLLSLDSFPWSDMIPTHHTGAVISNIEINPLSQMGIGMWMRP